MNETLRKLALLPNLKALSLAGNPLCLTPGYCRERVADALPELIYLDGVRVPRGSRASSKGAEEGADGDEDAAATGDVAGDMVAGDQSGEGDGDDAAGVDASSRAPEPAREPTTVSFRVTLSELSFAPDPPEREPEPAAAAEGGEGGDMAGDMAGDVAGDVAAGDESGDAPAPAPTDDAEFFVSYRLPGVDGPLQTPRERRTP